MTDRTMQQVVIEGPERLGWRECPRPALQTGFDALLKPLVVGRCDLDVAIVTRL